MALEASWSGAAADPARTRRATLRLGTAGGGAAGGAVAHAAEGGSHWWRRVASKAHARRSAVVRRGRAPDRWVRWAANAAGSGAPPRPGTMVWTRSAEIGWRGRRGAEKARAACSEQRPSNRG